MKNPEIYFRADGNSKIGLGHVIRSLALAEMLISHFDCHFIIQKPSATLKQQILEVCKSIIELKESDDYSAEANLITEQYLKGDEIVVLDGYFFNTDYQRKIKTKGCKLVCIDDIFEYHFVADAVINHSGGISESQYSAEDYTKFYLGLQYLLLRKPFREIAKDKSLGKETLNDVFVCLGGADPNNDLLKVLTDCEQVNPKLNCYVVIGGAYLFKQELFEYKNNSKLKITVLENLSAQDMANIMRKCGVGITSPSTVALEYLSTKGVLFLKQTASNQKHILKYFIGQNYAYNFNELDTLIKQGKSNSFTNQKNSLDGLQERRLQKAFLELNCTIREAELDDCNLIYEWINDKETRNQSFSTETIPFTNHKNWLIAKLKQEDFYYFIVLYNNIPCGQIRFSIDQNSATLSYLVAPDFRGNGFGKIIVEMGIVKIKNREIAKQIIAFVRFNNIASNKIFRSLGFKESLANEYENSFKYTLNL